MAGGVVSEKGWVLVAVGVTSVMVAVGDGGGVGRGRPGYGVVGDEEKITGVVVSMEKREKVLSTLATE